MDACVLVCVDICIHSAALSSRSHFGFQFHRHFRFNASSVICIFYLLLLSLHERLERNAIDEVREREKMTTHRLASRGDNANNKSSQLPHQILAVFYRGEVRKTNEQFICCTNLKIVLVGKTILVKSKMFRIVCKYELHSICVCVSVCVFLCDFNNF